MESSLFMEKWFAESPAKWSLIFMKSTYLFEREGERSKSKVLNKEEPEQPSRQTEEYS